MWQVGTNVLEEPAACIFRAKAFYPEVGGIWFLQNFTTCQYHTRKYLPVSYQKECCDSPEEF